jgi:U3 small nucleolar RNA-associated protein 10
LVRTRVVHAIKGDNANTLIGFVAETATFISECAEDENDSVVRETHKLKNAVEGVAGSISGL